MNIIKELFIKVKNVRSRIQKETRLKKYFANKRIPWSEGYEDYKWDRISEFINDASFLLKFVERKQLPEHYGLGLDERIVEYPFVFSILSDSGSRILDAGSTFNFASVISHSLFSKRSLRSIPPILRNRISLIKRFHMSLETYESFHSGTSGLMKLSVCQLSSISEWTIPFMVMVKKRLKRPMRKTIQKTLKQFLNLFVC